MTGFNLFHHLHEMLSGQASADDAVGHDKQLWDVALKSQCTEVSLAAIDYLNNCYMSGKIRRAIHLIIYIQLSTSPFT